MQLHVDSTSQKLARGRHRQSEQAAAEFERVLTRISTTFAGAQWHRVWDEVDPALRELLRFCALDYECIFEVVGDSDACLRHVACVPAMPVLDEPSCYAESFPWACERAARRAEVVALGRIEDAPPHARVDAASMNRLGLRSILHVPLRIEGAVRFVLTAGAKRRLPAWPAKQVARITALGEIFAHAIARAESVAAVIAADHDLHVGRWEWNIGADRLHLSSQAKAIFGDVRGLAQMLALVDPSDRDELERSLARARAQPGMRFETS